jgi:GNAT superfamily N-acetyltransferase
VKLVRYADRPELIERRERLSGSFPTYMHHNEPGRRYWLRLYDDHPAFQLALVDGDEPIAELHSVPTPWDGGDADLPSGWDEAFTRAFESDREATVLCALAIAIMPERRGEGLSSLMINAMRDAGRAAGLRELIAPVRPTLKERYPLIPIERFVEWRGGDGTHLDPWIRTHERVGGRIIGVAPRSMVIEAPAADWEEWTGLRLPEDGTYVVDGMLAPLNVRNGVGRHVEPNVWMRHAVDATHLPSRASATFRC